MSKRRTPEEYKKLIYEKYGDEYTLLSNYIRSTEKIHVRHNICGTEWKPNAGDLLKSNICPSCGKKKNYIHIIKTPEKFRQEFDAISNGEYELKTKYHRSNKKVIIKHIRCGHEFEMRPQKFLSGQKCPFCRPNRKKTQQEFNNAVYDLYGDEFIVTGTFQNTYTKIDLFHNKCSNTICVKPSDFLLKKTYCPYCNQSALETIISKALNDLGIQFEIQKTFNDLLGIKGNKLSYDFYFKLNDKIYLVEGQGEQHYNPVKFFGNDQKYQKQMEHDERKRKYAIDHNIELIEIPYWEFKNVKGIIQSRLLKQSA